MNETMSNCAAICPICGKGNSCGNVQGKAHGSCWCSNESFPEDIFKLVPEEKIRKSCICQECLSAFKRE
ncbi:cysteine-rich CWC family protein [Ectobacillus sp. sgz5001026]|uniref:cysteine-rich CWC family protein n=1 Tax=Ectobacillus sp. sgz5001026 TaxID=3242473 RepID=UPI0036D2E2AD